MESRDSKVCKVDVAVTERARPNKPCPLIFLADSYGTRKTIGTEQIGFAVSQVRTETPLPKAWVRDHE